MNRPQLRVTSVTIGAPDPLKLAEFYNELLGWKVGEIEGNWAQLWNPAETGLSTLNFEVEPEYARPTWPSVAGEQQIMAHLDIAVEDLEAAVAWAIQLGATLAEHQPQQTVRVMLDPAGHPFCLFANE